MEAIQTIRKDPDNKQRALDVLIEIKTKKRLKPEQLSAVDGLIAELKDLLQIEADMKLPPDPAMEAKMKAALAMGKAKVEKLCVEASVAIVAGEANISNADATVVVQDIDKRMAEEWARLQRLLAGEAPDQIDQTWAIMKGKLWETTSTVSIDSKLAKAYAAFIKRTRPKAPYCLADIKHYFETGQFEALLSLLEKKSVLVLLGISPKDRLFLDLYDLLVNYAAGPGGN